MIEAPGTPTSFEFIPAPVGSLPGLIKVEALRAEDGRGYVRIMLANGSSLMVLDLPTQADDGKNLAEEIGLTMVKAARQARSRLLLA